MHGEGAIRGEERMSRAPRRPEPVAAIPAAHPNSPSHLGYFNLRENQCR